MTEAYHLNALPPGMMLQEYEVLRVLGEGSFGIVYLCKCKYLDDLVAIKEYLPSELATRVDGTTVTPTSSGNEEFFHWGRQKFLEEARMLRQLANPRPHPNIVAVRRFFELNGTAYLVMDYEQGEALSDLLDRERCLPEPRVRALMSALLDGLEAVHAAGITHRDIKPSNIFLRADGTPVLLDFGAARLELGEKTQSTFSAMSPAYAAAEQVLSSDKIGPWTDIYGLGATLYRAVTGRRPQPALERLVEDAHLTAAELAGGSYSLRLLEVIDAAMTLRADDRPRSVAAWRALLAAEPEQASAERFSGEETVVQSDLESVLPPDPGPAGASEAARPRPPLLQGRRPGLAAVVLGVLTLAVGATFGAYYLPGEETGEARQAAPDKTAEARRLAEAEARIEAEEVARRLAVEAQRLAVEAQRLAEAEHEAAVEAQRLAEAEHEAAAEAQRLAAAEAERETAAEAERETAAEAERETAAEAQRLAAAAAEREAAEARRLAEAEAGRKAAEARRLAEAEAQRKAAEARRLAAAEAERLRLAELEAHVAANKDEVARALLRFWRPRNFRQFDRGEILEWKTLRSEGDDFVARVEFYLYFRVESPYSNWDTKTFRVRRTEDAVEFLDWARDDG